MVASATLHTKDPRQKRNRAESRTTELLFRGGDDLAFLAFEASPLSSSSSAAAAAAAAASTPRRHHAKSQTLPSQFRIPRNDRFWIARKGQQESWQLHPISDFPRLYKYCFPISHFINFIS
mmetsp:Transcript_6152/g.16738  ORF Transcript_6152/g.16738 Transcript_6152/m.16738 type:complete len:121 (-) Transcript_6152:34-396(-)